MSRVGRIAASAAVALVVLAVATWGRGSGASEASPVDGAALFVAKGCATCHVGPASTPGFTSYPPLDDAASWAGDRRRGMSAEAYLAESMAAPQAFVSPVFTGTSGPGTAMPRLRLTAAEIDALVDHLLGR